MAHRNWMLLALLVLIVAACGGSDDSGAPETSPSVAESTPPTASNPDTTKTTPVGDTDDPEPGGQGINAAMVTIEGESFEFDVTEHVIARCEPDQFGLFFVIGQTTDGSTLTLTLPRDGKDAGTEPPSVTVKDVVNDRALIADRTLIEKPNFSEVIGDGQSQVDDYQVEGNSVTGTATFIDEQQIFAALGGTGDPPEPLVGSFTVQCDG